MSIGRNTSYNLIGAIVPMALALATVPLYLKLVGADRYGVLSIAFLLLGYFGLFDLGLGRATTYRIAALKDADAQTRADVFWTAIAVNILMGAVGAAVLFVAADYFFAHVFKVDAALRPEIVESVPLLALSVPVATLTGTLSGALQARERFLQSNMISILSTSLFQILPLILAYVSGPRLGPLLAAALAARSVAILMLWWACRDVLTRGQSQRFSGPEARQLLGYGGWVTVTALFGPMLVILDRFAIGAILGAVAVTIYTVPFQLAQRLSVIPGALSGALFPRLPTASEAERITLTDNAILALLAALSAPVLVACYLIHPFFDLWIGRELGRQSAEVGVVILLGFWINAFAVVPYSWLQATGRPDLVTKLLLVQIPPYLAALYVGMSKFGLMGCAVVFSLRCAVDFIAMALAARGRVSHGRWIALLGLVLVAGTAAGALLDYRQPLWWLSGIGLAALATAISWAILPAEFRVLITSRLGALRRRAG